MCFSIRSFTEDKIIAGRKTKMLKKIVTWDTVNEPGISQACKMNTSPIPSLEALGLSREHEADLEMSFFTDSLKSEIVQARTVAEAAGASMESSMQLFNLVAEIEKPIKVYMPISSRW